MGFDGDFMGLNENLLGIKSRLKGSGTTKWGFHVEFSMDFMEVS